MHIAVQKIITMEYFLFARTEAGNFIYGPNSCRRRKVDATEHLMRTNEAYIPLRRACTLRVCNCM